MPNPLFYFDNSCGLCRYWTTYWQKLTGGRVEYRPFEQPNEKKSSEYVDENGIVYQGAEGVARLLANAPGKSWFLFLYQHVKPFALFCEFAYRLVSSCRSCGTEAKPLFFMLIGIVCLVIFFMMLVIIFS